MKFNFLNRYVFERMGRFRFKIRQIHECDFEECLETFPTRSEMCLHKRSHIGEFCCDMEGCNYMCFSKRTLLVHKGCDHGQRVLEAVPIESAVAIDWCEEEKEHVPPRCAVWIRCDLCSYKCLFEESMEAHMALHERIG